MNTPVWKTAVLWVLTLLLGAFFVMAGGTKLAASESQSAHFIRWGYPGWFLYLVGFLETAGAIGLLVPRLAGLSALLLGGVMVGAALTHLVHDYPNEASDREAIRTAVSRILASTSAVLRIASRSEASLG